MSKREKWKKAILNELVTLQRGHDLTSKEQKSGNIPVVGSYGIIGYHDTAKSKGPGVTVGRSGSIGEVQYIKTDYWSHNTCLYAINFHNNEVRYVYYFLKSMNLSVYNAGSAVPTPNRNHIHTIPVEIPPMGTQHKIANVLGSLDDRIVLLKKINATLEKVVRSLFKSWFIDFDGQTEFVDSELGEIPKGLEVKRIDDVCQTYGGGTPSTKNPQFWDGNINWAVPYDLTKNDNFFLEETERKITEEGLNNCASNLHPIDSILMTSRASIGFFSINKFPVAINQGFILIRPKRETDLYYLLNNFQNRVLEFIHNANGTTFLEISKGVFRQLPITFPPKDILETFHKLMKPIYEKLYINEKRIKYLKEIRDLLLPKLMSGEIKV